MTYPAHLARPLVLRARRDTIVLVVAATAMTFALAHLVETHRSPTQIQAEGPQQAWTGDLAGLVSPTAVGDGVEPLTSASLVVPQSELALPQPPMRALVKLRGCGGHSCTPPKPASSSGPASSGSSSRATAENVSIVERHVPRHRAKPSLMSRLNPLNHLPDSSSIKRPFVFASDTVSGWFR